MLSAADNDLLTRTGIDTPMGQFFRQFWQPIALSKELVQKDGSPLCVKIMGEEFIAFRNTRGELGLVDSKCPHRGANLFYGRNEECGIRCVFHGWKFDIDGMPMELPNVPPGAQYHETIRLRSFPVAEFGGIIWGYLGATKSEAKNLAPPPMLEMGLLPESHRYVTKKLQECNWVQSLEGALDTSHFSFLHMPAPTVPSNQNADAPADEKRLKWIREDTLPQFSIIEHEAGFVVGGSRMADEGKRYWRTAQFALPSHSTTPSTLPGETYFGYTWVPINDESCWIYTYAWNPERPLTEEEVSKFKGGHGVIAEVDEHYIPIRNRSNNYLIDREMQKHINYTGVRGVAEQDAMIQDSQGRIADRASEHLCASDIAIVQFRRKVMEGAREVMRGVKPPSASKPSAYSLRSGSYIADEGVEFEQVMLARFGTRSGLVVAKK
ncbi:Rieske 2Fe-2S domain-containing protein [Polynucleobacter sp.]|uniref:Rieske 2Fe-2S domain-containing protein n=1 Tax=Polynucleobacter sp. TaxID=2029855 RepID=UPI00258787B2|nr:Rieske 2Fe-2S domain-containing protein [Polynucleobacter sp.]MCX7237226.1 Rieske 2Fe-2S domain-containing protein [Polynucleobacter sp.]